MRPAAAMIACACLLAMAGCAAPAAEPESGAQGERPAAPGTPQGRHTDRPKSKNPKPRQTHRHTGTAAAMLKKIPLRPEASAATYQRAYFGGWTTRGGCTTRQRVLTDESRRGSAAGCSVRRGSWLSAYDGRRTKNPSSLDIDHLVPLGQAWVSGASRWTAGTRIRYANDLGYPGTLRAVSAWSNRSKGDRDPAQWLPPRRIHRCKYIGTWIAVKYRWQMSADRAERRVLRRYVKDCARKADVKIPRRATVRIAKHGTGGRRRSATRRGTRSTDRRHGTCAEAIARGLGPYRRGIDREYNWYRDADGDGLVCER